MNSLGCLQAVLPLLWGLFPPLLNKMLDLLPVRSRYFLHFRMTQFWVARARMSAGVSDAVSLLLSLPEQEPWMSGDDWVGQVPGTGWVEGCCLWSSRASGQQRMAPGLVILSGTPRDPQSSQPPRERSRPWKPPKPPFPGRLKGQSHRNGAHIFVGPTREGNKQLNLLCPPSCGLPSSDFWAVFCFAYRMKVLLHFFFLLILWLD